MRDRTNAIQFCEGKRENPAGDNILFPNLRPEHSRSSQQTLDAYP